LTEQWINSAKNEYLDQSHVLFEGQMRIAFIEAALKKNSISNYKIILVDCKDSIREHRLNKLRQQPDLYNKDMLNWALFLREEAKVSFLKMLCTA
jgi:hypothetical protein